jgi:hypothetical protein
MSPVCADRSLYTVCSKSCVVVTGLKFDVNSYPLP